MVTLLVICTSLLLTLTNHFTNNVLPNSPGLTYGDPDKPSAMFTEYAERITAADGELYDKEGLALPMSSLQ